MTEDVTIDAGRADARTPRPPVTVVLAVVLTMIITGLGVLEGVAILLLRYDPQVVDAALTLPVSLAGIAGILASLLLGALAAGVWRGSRVARIVVTIVAALALVLDAVTISSAPTGLWWTVADAAFYLVIIVTLWAGRATAVHFRPRPRGHAAGEAAP